MSLLSHTSAMARNPEGRSYLQAAKDAALRAGLSASDMQFFPAGDRLAAQVCQDAVRACRIYIGILGHDYGSRVREQPEISYTELEFLTAVEERKRGNMRILVFLVRDGVAVGERSTPDEDQMQFRRRVCKDHGLTAKYIATPDNLELEVYHALTELTSAVKRPSTTPRRVRIWSASAAGLLATAGLAAYWSIPRPATNSGPGPASIAAKAAAPELKELSLAVDEVANTRMVRQPRLWPLVKEGRDQIVADLPPLTDRHAFLLDGTFDRPVHWYLAWFDTEGEFQVNDVSPEASTAISYPSDGTWQTVSPTDRKGIHLLMLVTSDKPPGTGKSALELALNQSGRPLQTLPRLWAVRGGGERIADESAGSGLDFLAGIRRKLPPGFQIAYTL